MLRINPLPFLLFGFLPLAVGCERETKLISVLPSLAVSATSVAPVATVGGAPVTETVTVVNGTDGSLEGLSVSVQFLGGQTGWLTATLSQSTATRDQAASIQLRATPGPLGLGVYRAKVILAAQGAGNGPIEIAVRLTIDPRPPAKLRLVTQTSSQSPNGVAFDQQPVVQLLNAVDEPVLKAGVVVAAAIGSGGGELLGPATAVTGPDGRAGFVGLAVLGAVGPRTLTFSASNLASATSTPVELIPGAAKALEAVSATTQVIDAGTAAVAPRARVVDQSGNGIAGFSVGFVASAGSSIAPNGSLTTSATGVAGPLSWVLSPAAGSNTVTASAPGLVGSPLTFSATGRTGAASELVKQSGDNVTGLVNAVLGTPHVIKVTDAFGNGVSGVAISWGVTGGGSVSPVVSTTDQGGSAQAVRTLPAAPGPVTTTASATIGGVSRSVSFAVTTVNSGPALIVKVTGDAQTAVAGATLPTALEVRVTNGLGNPEPNASVTFTTPNGGTFPGGAVIVTGATGLASTTWKLSAVAGAQTAQAAVGGPAPVVFTATATAGAVSASQSSVAVSPGSITAGGPGSVITVTAKDAGGNPISGLPVVLGVIGAATTTPIGATNASGQATSTLTATVAGNKLVSATVGGIPITQTSTVTVVAGTPTQIVALVTTSPSVRFGLGVSPTPSVQVRDGFGNGVPGVTVSFGVTTGQSSVAPTSTATNSSGTASVSSWVIGALFAGPSADNVYNRVVATASGAGISGNPITFLGTAAVSFGTDLAPFFRRTQAAGGCTQAGCHGSSQVPNFSSADATLYAFLTTGSRYVVASDSVNSTTTTNLLWRKPGLGHTPPAFPANRVTLIKAWIAQGAPNN